MAGVLAPYAIDEADEWRSIQMRNWERPFVGFLALEGTRYGGLSWVGYGVRVRTATLSTVLLPRKQRQQTVEPPGRAWQLPTLLVGCHRGESHPRPGKIVCKWRTGQKYLTRPVAPDVTAAGPYVVDS